MLVPLFTPRPHAWAPYGTPTIGPSVVPALSLFGGKLWQDAGKTVPAKVDGDPVRVATCPFTGVDFSAASSGTRPVLHTDGAGHWYLTFDGIDDFLGTASNGPVAQVWTFTVATLGYTGADELSGYTTAGASEQDVARLFPDINTWFTGNADDVVAFSGGAGLVNGVAGNSNSPAVNFKVIELTRATPYTPTAPYNLGSSKNAVAPRFFNGRVAAAVQLGADQPAATRARLRKWLGSLAGLAL